MLAQSLWVGPQLTPIEIACIRSFLVRGHRFELYCYDPPRNTPAGCTLRDAGEILDRAHVFAYRHGPEAGSYAGFADLFRFKLLFDRGGWWVDTDVVCTSSTIDSCGVQLAREDETHVNIAIMHFPAGHPAMAFAYRSALDAGRDIGWGQTGPVIGDEIVKRFALEAELTPRARFYPVHWRDYTAFLLPAKKDWVDAQVADASFVHLWNEMFRRANYDKFVRPPQGSYLATLMEGLKLSGFESEYVLMPSSSGSLRMQRAVLAKPGAHPSPSSRRRT